MLGDRGRNVEDLHSGVAGAGRIMVPAHALFGNEAANQGSRHKGLHGQEIEGVVDAAVADFPLRLPSPTSHS